MRKSLVEVYLHLVWTTWDRISCITPDIEPTVYSIILKKCEEHNCAVVAIGGVEDHIHLLIRPSHLLDIAHLVRDAKGVSSHYVTSELKPGSFFRWQGGYGAFSVDPRSVPAMRGYISNQKTHHADNTAPPYLERYLADDVEPESV